ncbi:nuclear transport factor 2 family protein [Sphingobacterium humi]|uniref:DUF4440 domain-containing protein n=1 Tax=Sphingobacterium humi TaxID=1796905 RepID=A0A6N8KZ83_9SPHI|nr:nuclear transport factor 2 family protein [Sphingobacterium humi]MVZ60872.1 DUF4440 domain-containing protein [Sphingobacterium humi]
MNTAIISLEKQYWQRMENHELDGLLDLTYFPCIVSSSKGIRKADKQSFVDMFEQGKELVFKVLSISEEEVIELTDQTAVIAYKVATEKTYQGKTWQDSCVCNSTWVLKDGAWKCAMHSEIELEK